MLQCEDSLCLVHISKGFSPFSGRYWVVRLRNFQGKFSRWGMEKEKGRLTVSFYLKCMSGI